MSEGVITNPKTKEGYGLVHIEARHGDQIRGLGFNSVIDFIEEVAKNYDVIREGKERDGQQTYLLQLQDKHNNTLIVELAGDGTYWNINTAGVFNTSYGRKGKEVYNRHTTEKQPAETAEASQDVQQSGIDTTSSMNAPTLPADKGSEKVGDKQIAPGGKLKTSGGSWEGVESPNPIEHGGQPQPIGYGEFGPIIDQFKGKAKDAIEVLKDIQGGEAVGALHHKDVGDIDLVWGNAGTGHSDGYGLAKLLRYHPEVVEHIQEILDTILIAKRTTNRIQLENDTHQTSVSLTWNVKKRSGC